METEFNKEVLSLSFRFYSKALSFPYDELTHEFQYLFREMEKMVESDLDNLIAAKVLDVINSYQGEEMSALQTEYSRLFSHNETEAPLISIQLTDFLSNSKHDELMDFLLESVIPIDLDEYPDTVMNVLDYFSSIIGEESEEILNEFLEKFIAAGIPAFSEQVYKGSNLNFYKEIARGLNEMIYLIT
ncbi:MAG: hypothetical protein AB7W47_15860 [Calditrichaceae bacterium]